MDDIKERIPIHKTTKRNVIKQNIQRNSSLNGHNLSGHIRRILQHLIHGGVVDRGIWAVWDIMFSRGKTEKDSGDSEQKRNQASHSCSCEKKKTQNDRRWRHQAEKSNRISLPRKNPDGIPRGGVVGFFCVSLLFPFVWIWLFASCGLR